MNNNSNTFHGLQIHSLKEVLQSIPLPPGFNASTVSSKWRCVLAPLLDESDEKKHLILMYLELGIPIMFSSPFTTSSCRTNFSTENSANNSRTSSVKCDTLSTFKKPQIATRNGWGMPGTVRDHSQFYTLVRSFAEVFDPSLRTLSEEEVFIDSEAKEESEKMEKEEESNMCKSNNSAPYLYHGPTTKSELSNAILSLQVFHRKDENHVNLPPYAEELQWPAVFENHVICETATVATQKGYQNWWKINDCGECVLEAALPLECSTVSPALDERMDAVEQQDTLATFSSARASPHGTTEQSWPCKLYLFGPRGSYDWFIHDDASLTSGGVSCMDIFHLADEELPIDSELLPVLTVCLLEAGGPALLQPPNLPFMSIMLQSSITIEQRCVSLLWLDEVSYFFNRTRLWPSDPFIYPLIEENFQDTSYMVSFVVPLLYELFRLHYEEKELGSASGSLQLVKEWTCRRAVASLLAIASFDKHFALPESSRKALLHTMESSNESVSKVLLGTWYTGFSNSCRTSSSCFLDLSLKEMLLSYWNTSEVWPKAGCVMRVPNVWTPSQSCAGFFVGKESHPFRYLPVVYVRKDQEDKSEQNDLQESDEMKNMETNYLPVFGCEELSPELTLKEYLHMRKLTMRPKELLAYLKVKKSPKDDILEALF